jgi:hypothetical protein
MKRSRFTEEQIIGFIKQAEAGMPINSRGADAPYARADPCGRSLASGARQGTCRLIYAASGCITFSKWALMTQLRSGLSVTAPMGAQLRVLPDHRAGFSARACRYRACRAARMT